MKSQMFFLLPISTILPNLGIAKHIDNIIILTGSQSIPTKLSMQGINSVNDRALDMPPTPPIIFNFRTPSIFIFIDPFHLIINFNCPPPPIKWFLIIQLLQLSCKPVFIAVK